MRNLLVLFVDGDAQLLKSLARLIATKRLNWSARFAGSGKEALRVLDEQECDVIITDASLKDMSGSVLLNQVKEQHSLILRILLTEQVDHSLISSLLKSAHQLLAKPCPLDQLVEAIECAISLRSLYMNPAVRRIIYRMEHLPVVPRIYLELTQELRKKDCAPNSLGAIIARDMGLTAGVLKMVNSPFFGLSRRIESPQQAVSFIGVSILKGLVIYEQIFKALNPANYPDFDVERLWEHSLNAARCCKAVVKHEGGSGKELDSAFSAGLLHDIGKIVLAEGCSEEYVCALQKSRSENLPLVEAEVALLGVAHAEVGAYLLGLWGFPEPLVSAIADHHEPSRGDRPSLLTAVLHCVDVSMHDLYVQSSGYSSHFLDQGYLSRNGWENKLEKWKEIVDAELDSTIADR
jgi:putative nucleotidyltransferase with HDIG domain